MDLFNRRQTPEIRKWSSTHAETIIRNASEKDVGSLLAAIVSSILMGVANVFCTEEQAKQGNKTNTDETFEKIATSFDNDWCLFEILCYFLFRLDAWLFLNGKNAFRDKYFSQDISAGCLSVFATIFKSDGVFAAFNNRCRVYGDLLRNQKGFEREMYYLTQFVYRTQEERRLQTFDVNDDFPLIIGNAVEEYAFHMRIAGYLSGHVSCALSSPIRSDREPSGVRTA